MSTGGTLFWSIVLLAGVVLVAPSLRQAEPDPAAPPAEKAGEEDFPEVPATAGNGYLSHALRRDPDGHFYAEAQVNGAHIRFMVDTGASVVALTRADAQRAGIALGSERATARGAGGEIEVIPVTIDRIAVGPLTADGVQGAVVEELPVSLLGQSFLARAAGVEISGDRMVLR